MRLHLYGIPILVLSLLISSPGGAQEIREGTDDTTKFASNTRAVALAFGTRPDAAAWAEGIASVTGSKDVMVIQNQFPTMDELVELFSQEPEWLFLGGHFDGWKFTNGVAENNPELERVSIYIYFYPNNIVINRGSEKRVLTKGKDFLLHKNLKYIFWGGCSAHRLDDKTGALLNVFASKESRPVSLGWTGRIGYQVTHAIMGGYGNEAPFASKDFFDRLSEAKSKQSLTDRDVIESWMLTSIETDWGEEHPIDDNVSVIDSYGDEWLIERGEIVKSVRPWADLSFAGNRERQEIRKQQLELTKPVSETEDDDANTRESRTGDDSSP